MTWYKEWFGEEYLELYSYRDEEEARQQVAFFQQHMPPIDGPLLDLACGKGRHLAEFRTRGCPAVGCDLSYTLLRTGTAEDGLMPVACADMRHLPFRDQAFAALASFFTSFGYFEEEQENERALGEMSRIMKRGAPFLFDYLNVERELKHLVRRERRDTEAGTVEIERWFDAASRTFNKRITMGSRRFLERVRGYTLDELSSLFQRCGLAVREVCGDFHGARYHSDSPRLIILGERTS
jgi:SAM-dependent methyltransferase